MATITPEIRYEGYGVNGIAIIVETMTDNVNRTAQQRAQLFRQIGRRSAARGLFATA